jgi:hypothetical protein
VSTQEVQQQERKRRHNEKKRRRRTQAQRAAEYRRSLARRLEHIAELRELWAKIPPRPNDLLDQDGACLYIGGSKPIDPSTLYRRYSSPIKVGLQAVRWPRSNLDTDIGRMNAVAAAAELTSKDTT